MTNFGNGNGFPESAISLLWNFLIIEGLGYMFMLSFRLTTSFTLLMPKRECRVVFYQVQFEFPSGGVQL